MKNKKRTLPIQLLIALSICISILISSTFFLVMAYKGMTRNIIQATQETAKYVAQTVNQSVKLTLAPCDVTVRMLYLSNIGRATTLSKRLEFIPLFTEALNANSIADAVYVGYATGEFFLLRRYEKSMGDLKVTAPKDTHFLLQTKTLEPDGTFTWEFWFLGENHELLTRQVAVGLSLDPRQRVWFKLAMEKKGLITTRPYVFFDTREVGISLAQKTPDSGAVVAIDATTKDLSTLLSTLLITPTTELVLMDETGEIVAYPDMAKLKNKPIGPDGAYELKSLEHPVLNNIFATSEHDKSLALFSDNTSDWYGMVTTLDSFYGNGLHMIIAIPSEELLSELQKNIIHQALIALAVLVVILIGGWQFGKWVSQPLHELTDQVIALSEFDFEASIGVPTRTREVDELGNVLRNMAQAINGFRSISRSLNRERNLEQMITSVLQQLLKIIRMQSGAVYLYNEKKRTLYLAVKEGNDYPEEIHIESELTDDGQLRAECEKDIGTAHIYSLLRNRENDLVGLLCLTGDDETPQSIHNPQSSLARYIENMASAVAVAIETRQLIHAQKALLDSLIKLIADAIDTKSRYTGGHCRRVPEFSLMLLEEITKSETPPFDTFSLSSTQNEEFRIAAWLHDCGKITTPEYVVDKATKLETIYNRLHEVRTRFEVLHRDATIRYLKALLAGEDSEQAFQKCQQEHQTLQDDFAFIAKCNIGGEAMAQADIDRLYTIGQQTWLRYFNNHLGLSKDESIRMEAAEEPETLPVEEYLLADKKWHLVPWDDDIPPVQAGDPNNTLGFDMKLPKFMYNYGELYNLSLRRGTLTEEERFKINDHIVQTLIMLSSLPLPKTMDKVPDIASNHHETLVGTGYPRRLNASQLGIPDRIIAIADIFEALTASDRPYKEGKTLKEALTIMSKMVRDGHLDSDIFNLMLRSGAYLAYARKFLEPDQIDVQSLEDVAGFLYTGKKDEKA